MGIGTNNQSPVKGAINAKLTYADFGTSGNTVKIGSLSKGTFKMHTQAFLVTAFTGTSSSFLVGTAGDDDQFLASGDLGELTVGAYLGITTGAAIITADCDIYAKLTFGSGSVSTAGEVHVVIEFVPIQMNKEMYGTTLDA